MRERAGSASDRLSKEVKLCGTFRDKFTTDFVGVFQANFTGKWPVFGLELWYQMIKVSFCMQSGPLILDITDYLSAHIADLCCQISLSLSISYIHQHTKLTFLKNWILVTFNCKMVANKNNSVAKKTLKGRTLHDIWHKGLMCRKARFQHFTCYSKRKRRTRLMSSSKNDLLQHYKAAETGWCTKPHCHFELQRSPSKQV